MTETAGGGSATTDQARETAQQVGTQAKEKAQEAGAQARSRVRDEVDRRSTEAGDQATSAADAMRQASRQLREQGNEPVAKGMEQAADRLERAGGWLRDSDGDAILSGVEDFGRRNPLAVAAAGLAVGFAASRLLKASSRRRYEGDGSGNGRASVPARIPEPVTSSPPTGPGTVAPPREGVTETGVTGGSPATSPPSWQGGLGGEGEGEGAWRG